MLAAIQVYLSCGTDVSVPYSRKTNRSTIPQKTVMNLFFAELGKNAAETNLRLTKLQSQYLYFAAKAAEAGKDEPENEDSDE